MDWKALPPPAPSQNGAGWWMACGSCQHKWWLPAPGSQEHRESFQKLKALLQAFDECVPEEAEEVPPAEEEKPSINGPAPEPREPEPPLVQVVKEEKTSSFDWEALLGEGAKVLDQEDPFSGCKGLSFADWLEAQKTAAQQDSQAKAERQERAEERSSSGKTQTADAASGAEKRELLQKAEASEDRSPGFKEILAGQSPGLSLESEEQPQALQGEGGRYLEPEASIPTTKKESLRAEEGVSEERRGALEVPIGKSAEPSLEVLTAKTGENVPPATSSLPHCITEEPSLTVVSSSRQEDKVQASFQEESQAQKEPPSPTLQEALDRSASLPSSSSELSSQTSQDSSKPVTEQDLQTLKDSLVQAFRDELAQVAKLTAGQMKDPRNQEILASKKGADFFPKKHQRKALSSASKPQPSSRSVIEAPGPQSPKEAVSRAPTLESPLSLKVAEPESVQKEASKETQAGAQSSPSLQGRSSDPVLSPQAFAADRLLLTSEPGTPFDLSRDKASAFWPRFKEKLFARSQKGAEDKSWPYEKGKPYLPPVLPKTAEEKSAQSEKEESSGEVIAVSFPFSRKKAGGMRPLKTGSKWALFRRFRKRRGDAFSARSDRMKGELLHFSPLGAGAREGADEPQSLNNFLQNATKTSGEPSRAKVPLRSVDEDKQPSEAFSAQVRKPSEESMACIAVTGTGAPPVLIPFPEGTEGVRPPALPDLPTKGTKKVLSAKAKLGLTMGITGVTALVALAVTIHYKEAARSLWEGTIPQTVSPKPDSSTLGAQPVSPVLTPESSQASESVRLDVQKTLAPSLPEKASVPETSEHEKKPSSTVGAETARSTVQGTEERAGLTETLKEALPDSALQARMQAPEMTPSALSAASSKDAVSEVTPSALPEVPSETVSEALESSETIPQGGAKAIAAEALPQSLSLEQVGYTVMMSASEGQATGSLLPRVVVTGEIVNLTEGMVSIPPILISITSMKWPGKMLYSGRYSHSATELPTHGRSPFQIEKVLPVDEDEDLKIELSFALAEATGQIP